MRAEHLVVENLIRAMGGFRRVSDQVGVKEITVRKDAEDPEESGQTMPLWRFKKYLATSRKFPEARPFALELTEDHYCGPAGQSVFLLTPEQQAAVKLLTGAFTASIYNSELPTECSACGSILIFVPVDGKPRPFCVRCKK